MDGTLFHYGREYDFSKPFFQQWKELRDVVPLQTMSNANAVNSDYCNVAWIAKIVICVLDLGQWKELFMPTELQKIKIHLIYI